MIFRFSSPKLSLLIVLAMLTAVSPAHAQTLRHGQRIFFSTEQSDTVSNTPAPTPSLLPQPPSLPKFETATTPQFALPAPTVTPMMVPTFSAAQAAQIKEAADKQKNWALMTPEEIFGVPTPEKMLGVDEKDRNQTTVERYYERQNRAKTNGTSAYYQGYRNDPNNPDNPNKEDDMMSRNRGLFSDVADNPNSGNREPNQFFGSDNSAAPRGNSGQRTMNSLFPSAFESTATTPVRTPEQVSADADFQKLLSPQISPRPALADNSSPFSTTPSQPSPPAPIGNSYTPLSSGIGVPEGIKPLPGLTDQKNPSTTPVNPAWESQSHLPPWMSPNAQAGTFPRRVDLRQ